MGEKRPKSAFGVLAGLSVTVCLMAAGCTTARPTGQGEAVTASANLSPDRSLAASDATSDVSDTQLSDPVGISELEAVVVPPAGWLPDPVKRSRNHAHQAWISPSGSTAYGVIRMNLPLPFIGPDTVLPRFLEKMRQTEGEATLLSRRNDGRLPGIRFVAEGGQYRLRANLVTRGFRAWAVYAGTLRDQPEVPDELQLAETAREKTKIGTTRVRSRNR
jgi:hypothetical protein